MFRSAKWALCGDYARGVGAEKAVTGADLVSLGSKLADLLRGHLSLRHCQHSCHYGSPTWRCSAFTTPAGRRGVFSTRTGAPLDAANVRREFRAACKAAKIGEHWTPRELRHSFVSLMSSSGVPVEEIARLAGHSSSRTTEIVYRRELRPVLTTGAEAMDRLFQAHVVQ